ncbi:MAG: cell division protein ZapA [Proteobacteria bacterium]|nr:cell division protein ZapA [Pseudomonadota bacterium]
MEKKVEVNILNQPFTFIGEDEERIRRVAQDVDERISRIVNDYGIVNTMNAVIMAMMELTDEFFEIRAHTEKFKGRTLNLLKRVEEL